MIKKKVIQTRKAFTLVEMMIVIAIIGLLAFLAMSAFGSANRSAKLDVATDTFVSVIRQQQGLAKSGKVDGVASMSGGTGSESASVTGVYCYGVRFMTESGKSVGGNSLSEVPAQVMLIKVPYVRVDENAADYCKKVEDSNLTALNSVTDVIIKSITWNGDDETSIDIMFKPPFAEAEVVDPVRFELTATKTLIDELGVRKRYGK